MVYKTPPILPPELDESDSHIQRYRQNKIDAEALNGHRAPLGCYEQSQDGTYTVRVRTTGGAVTPLQLRAIADTSARYGSDAIHVTTRQEFQIQDIALEYISLVERELLLVGLAARGSGGNTVENVLVSPDAGVGLDEAFDPSPFAFALTSRLIAEPGSWRPPRKFEIAFSNSPADSSYAEFQDLGFVARIRGEEKGFCVWVAGGLGANPGVGHLLDEFSHAGDVHLVTTAVKRLLDKHGNRKNRHVPSLSELYQEELQLVRRENPAPLTIEELPQSSMLPLFAPEQNHSEEFYLWKDRYVENQKQAGLVSVRVPTFLGKLRNAHAIRLAEFLAPFGDNVLRASFGQNLRLRNIPKRYLANLFHLVRGISGISSGPRHISDSIACTSVDACRLIDCRSQMTSLVRTCRDAQDPRFLPRSDRRFATRSMGLPGYMRSASTDSRPKQSHLHRKPRFR